MAIILAILVAGLVFWLQWQYFRKHWQQGLTVQVRFARHGVPAGERCQLREIITNAKRMPLPALQVKLQTTASFTFPDDEAADVSDYYYRTDFYALEGNRQVTRTLDFIPRQRGYFQIRSVDLLAKDFFHTSRYSNRRDNETGIYVYPYKKDTGAFELLYRQIMGEMIAKKQMEEDLFAFRGLREYRPTDSMRRINWKRSASGQGLLVNMYESTFSQRICILLDGHTRSVVYQSYLQESAISIASSIAERLLREGIALALETNMQDVLTGERSRVETGVGRYQMESVDRCLAGIALEKSITDYKALIEMLLKEDDGQTVYLLITSGYTEELFDLLKQQKKKGIECFGIVPWREDEERAMQLPPEMTYWEV